MKKPFRIILFLAFLSLIVTSIVIYDKIFSPNISLPDKTEKFICIPTGSGFEDVVKTLNENKLLHDSASFKWLAGKMKYKNKILPGRYRITEGMNNKDLILLLRSGKQTPVHLTLNNLRTATQLASVVSETLEADSVSVFQLLNDDSYLKQFGFNKQNSVALFIPNTYEFYWNTSANKFFERMAKEYKIFWNDERKQKAGAAGLSQSQVSILASIIQQETNQNDEKPVIAGVYLNRFFKGWKLEADPTLVFALGDFSVQRVLSEYKNIDSPYNTYLYSGLPPGPICIPSIASIDAVLNFTHHEFMYFCARDDFSGYHVFSKSYDEQMVNARKFQKELNKRNIKS